MSSEKYSRKINALKIIIVRSGVKELDPPLLLNVNQRSKELRWVGESWDDLTKRVLVEKHIIGIMYENSEGPRPLAPHCQRQ